MSSERYFVVSPQLVSIGGLYVSIPVPPGWRVGTLDKAAWMRQGRSGEFTLVPSPLSLRAIVARLHIKKPEVTILLNNDDNTELGMRKQVADNPRSFKTKLGMHGVVSTEENVASQISWSMTIPLKAKKGVVSIWLDGIPGNLAEQRKFAYWIFNRLRVTEYPPGRISNR